MPRIPDGPDRIGLVLEKTEILQRQVELMHQQLSGLYRMVEETREQVRILSAQHPFTPDPNDECSF